MNLFYVFIALLPSTTLAQLTNEQRHEILNMHNDLRRSVRPPASDMLELSWDYNLEEVAQSYAEGCEFEHNDDRHAHYQELGGLGKVGENLAIGTGDSRNIEYFMQAWWDEWMNMESMNSDDWDSTGAGHYSQMAWADTYSIGCGLYDASLDRSRDADCDGYERYFVCDYYPFGNQYGDRPYRRGTPCTNCPKSHSFCNNGLCSSENNTLSEEEQAEVVYEEYTEFEAIDSIHPTSPGRVPVPRSTNKPSPNAPPSPDVHRTGRCRGHFGGRCAEIRDRFEEDE